MKTPTQSWLKSIRHLFSRRRDPLAVRPRAKARLAVECLEDRVAPATFTVSLTTDTGPTNSTVTPLGPGTAGDLRNAIFPADQTPGTANVIDLTGVSGTITLKAMLPPIFTTGAGSLTINGPGAGNLTISGNNSFRPFFITQGTVSINGLTIANGLAKGGDAGNGGAGQGGGGAGLGGGLLTDGTTGATTVTLTNVTFNNDKAIGGTGGKTIFGVGGGGGGGGAGGNGVDDRGGGGGFLGNGGSSLANAGNGGGGGGAGGGTGGFGGGGGGSGAAGGAFGGNGVGGSGGGGAGLGGALFQRGGTLHLVNTTFTGNSTTEGSGGPGAGRGLAKAGALCINAGATADWTGSLTFSGNSATDAGAVNNNPQDNANLFGTLLAQTTTAAANASAVFRTANQNVMLSATVTSNAGVVNTGTVTFKVFNGASQVGASVTSGTVTAGAASATYVLPGNTTTASSPYPSSPPITPGATLKAALTARTHSRSVRRPRPPRPSTRWRTPALPT